MLHNSYLTKTKQGISFDGSIRNAQILDTGVVGEIYNGTPRFKDGEIIHTSEIVEVGFIPAIGWYVETLNRSRYHIASTGYSACQKGIVKDDMEHRQFYIDSNINYFKPLQWS